MSHEDGDEFEHEGDVVGLKGQGEGGRPIRVGEISADGDESGWVGCKMLIANRVFGEC